MSITPTSYLGVRSRSSCIKSEPRIETPVFDHFYCNDICTVGQERKHSELRDRAIERRGIIEPEGSVRAGLAGSPNLLAVPRLSRGRSSTKGFGLFRPRWTPC